MNKFDVFTSHKCQYYCKRLEVTVPDIIFREKEYNLFNEYLKQLYKDRYVPIKVDGTLRGASSLAQETIFINLDSEEHKTYDDVEETLIHELVHYTKPSYKHYTKRFQECCKKLKQGRVKNGRFF